MSYNEYDEIIQGKDRLTGNEYDDMLNDDNQAAKKSLQQNMYVAKDKQPDRHAEIMRLSEKTKLPVELVERNYDLVKQEDVTRGTDYDSIIKQTPALGRFMQDQNNATLSKDDIDALSRVEKHSSKQVKDSFAMDIGKAAKTGLYGLESSAAHLAMAYGKLDVQNGAEIIAEANRRQQELADNAPDYVKEFNKIMAEEGDDVDKAWTRFRGSYDEYKKGEVLKALKDFGVGGAKTVGETIDMIVSAGSMPRGLTYSTVQNLANAFPSLVTGYAGMKVGSMVGAPVGGAIGSIVPGAGTLAGVGAGAVVGGVAGAGAGTFAGSVGTEIGAWINESLTKRGYDLTNPDDIKKAYSDKKLMAEVRGEAERKGVTTAGVDALFSMIAGKYLAGAKGAGVGKKVVAGAKEIGVQAVGEAGSEFAGQVAAYGDVKKANLGEAIQEGIISIGQAVPTAITGAAARASKRAALPKDTVQAAEQLAIDTTKAQEALVDAQNLQELGNAVKESKLAARMPEKIKELVDMSTEGGEATSVFFQTDDFDSYWSNKGKQPAAVAAEIMGDGGKAYHDAKETGAPLEVPLGQYVSKVAPTPEYDELLNIARTRPDGMTVGEANEHLQALPQTMKELSDEANKVVPAQETTADQEAKEIAKQVADQLVATGTMSAKDAKANAVLYERGFKVLAERAGVTPKQLFEKYGLGIQKIVGGEPLDVDNVLNQNTIPKTDEQIIEEFEKKETDRVDEFFSKDERLVEYDNEPETFGGRLLDADMARKLLPEAKENMSAYNDITNKPAGLLIKKQYEKKLKEPVSGDVLIMAGGPGSGKSETIKQITKDGFLDGFDLIYDSVSSSYDISVERIDKALESGRKITWTYILSDFDDALSWVEKRYNETGRPVDADFVAEAYVKSLETTLKLIKKYQNEPRVSFQLLERSRKSEGRAITVDDLEGLVYNENESTDQVIKRLSAVANERLKNVSEETKRKKRESIKATATKRGFEFSGNDGGGAEGGTQRNDQVKKTLYQSSPQVSDLGFYSKLEATILEKVGGSVSVDQLKATLKDIKPEEIKWSGLDEFLKNKKTVSKDELLAFVRGNQLEIREVTLGDVGVSVGAPVYTVFSPSGEGVGTFKDEDAAKKAAKLYNDEARLEVQKELDKEGLPHFAEKTEWTQEMADENPERGFEVGEEVWVVYGPDADSDMVYGFSRENTAKKQAEELNDNYVEEQIGHRADANYRVEETEYNGETLEDTDPYGDGGTKFGQYTLPGGENYREVLLTMPPEVDMRVVENKEETEYQGDGTTYYDVIKGKDYAIFTGTLDEANEYIESEKKSDRVPGYTSSHFDEKNILAHVRLKDRTDADGKKVLFAEEIQSDWHQTGRKKGYKGDIKSDPELKALADEYDDIWYERADIYLSIRSGDLKKVGDKSSGLSLESFKKLQTSENAISGPRTIYELKKFGEGSESLEVWYEPQNKISKWSLYINGALNEKFKNKDEVNNHLSKLGVLSDRLIEIQNQRKDLADKFNKIASEKKVKLRIGDYNRDFGKGAVPDAPFKKTWHEFALKRIIRMAAEQGYDRVAWTTGEQQAERYDLSKQIDNIRYRKDGEGTYEVSAIKSGNTVVSKHGQTEEQLEDIFGKDIAEKIIAQKGDKATVSGEPVFLLSGLDLKVGGEGMKGFYDKMLVAAADRLVKKFGGKVGVSEIDVSPGLPTRNEDKYRVVGKDNDVKAYANDLETATDHAKSWPGSRVIAPNEKIKIETKVHSIDITPKLKDAALNEGFSLFQKNRGQIRFGADRKFNIDLLEKADPSTFIHETGHFYLEILGDLAEADGATQAVKDDYATLLKWFGVDSRDQITREHHEQFARGFEAYLMEGKAPSLQLQKIFTRFRVWLTSVYKELRNLNVNLTDDVRSVFDRMLATDKEIEELSKDMSMEPMFGLSGPLAMNNEKAKKYYDAVEAAKEETAKAIDVRLMDDYIKTKEQIYKEQRDRIESEVTDQVNNMNFYKALAHLQKGKMPDGSPLPEGVQPVKLDKAALVKEYGNDFVKKLPKPYVYTTSGGIHHNIMAEMYGFQDGDTLLQMIVNMPSRDAMVKQMTDQRMEELHPDLLHDGDGLTAEVINAAHNDAREEKLRMELEHLFENSRPVFNDLVRRLASRVPSSMEVKNQARGIIGSTSVRDLKPHKYRLAEAKYAKLAGQAFVKGDIDAAFEAKKKEYLNFELYRAAEEARRDVEKSAKDLKKIFRKSEEDLAKTRDTDMVNAAKAVLASYGIGRSDKTPEEYLSKIATYDPDGYQTIKALVDDATKMAQDYKSVSYDDFTVMKDAVQALWDLSKTSREMEIDGKKVDTQVIKGELMNRLTEVTNSPWKAGYEKAITKIEKAQMYLMGARSALRRTESWAEAVDNGRGVFTKYMVQPVLEAASTYRIDKKAALEKYLSLVKGIEKSLTKEIIRAPELGYKFEGKQELLGALLHTGNESNLYKLLVGRNWGEALEGGQVDKTRWNTFIERMYKEGVITKADMDFVQATWDLLESFKMPAQQAHKNMYGFYFNEVTANPVTTPFGIYRGGYMPAVADSNIAMDANIRNEKESLEKSNNSFMFPTAGRGFTKGRVESYAAPLSINMSMVPAHIDKVLRFIHLEPRVKEVSRVVFDREFRQALNSFDPTVAGDMLVPWLQRAAQQKISVPMQGWGGKGLDWLFKTVRARAGLQTMVMNVTNTLQQFTGLSVAAVKVKPRFLRNALWTYVRSPKKTAESVNLKSKFMSTRNTTNVIEITAHIDDLLLNPTKYEKALDFATKHGYFLQGLTQNIVDNMVWVGAYDQAIESGSNEIEAVRSADSAVRQTQGSFNPEDISRFETGTAFMRAFTMFYSYFNMQANLLGTEFSKVTQEMGLRKGAGRMLYIYSLGLMIPAVVSELLVIAMSGKDLDEDDDDEYLDDAMSIFFGSQFRNVTALAPIVGPAAQAVAAPFNDKWYDDRITTSPAVSMVESAAKAPFDVYAAIAEKGNKNKAIKDSLTLIGLLTGFPLAPISRPISYGLDVASGKAEPTGPVDFTRGLVTGKAGNN